MLDYRMPVEGSLIGEAIQTGQAIAVTDAEHDPHVRSDPRRLALVRQTGVQSMIVVPLLSGDHPLGAISISDKTAGTYGPDDERVLEMLASSAVIGLENARLYQAEQERRQVAEGLREVLAILNSKPFSGGGAGLYRRPGGAAARRPRRRHLPLAARAGAFDAPSLPRAAG